MPEEKPGAKLRFLLPVSRGRNCLWPEGPVEGTKSLAKVDDHVLASLHRITFRNCVGYPLMGNDDLIQFRLHDPVAQARTD